MAEGLAVVAAARAVSPRQQHLGGPKPSDEWTELRRGFYLSPTRYLQPSGPMLAVWPVFPGTSKRSPGL